MEKYYTPTIDEFHEGFIYNRLMTNGWSKERKWSYETTAPLHLVQKEIEKEQIRVKYIDKEDIESLGFEGQQANTVYFKIDGYRLVHWLKETPRNLIIYKVYDRTEEEKIFDGYIKNKSEFKKLLKQLKIIE